jgi:putative phosphoribosyl transferase
MNNIFYDREDAAHQLLDILPQDSMKNEKWNLIAVSPGGLVLANALRLRMRLSLDYLFSEGIYAPNNSDCEIARVSETEEIILHDALIDAFDIKVDYIYGEANRKHEDKILSKVYQHRKGEHFISQEGCNVVLVDEGCEGGLKMMVAIKTILAMNPRAVYIVTPIIPSSVMEVIEPLVDEVYCLHEIDDFVETQCYYEKFDSVCDEEIEYLLGENSGLQCKFTARK